MGDLVPSTRLKNTIFDDRHIDRNPIGTRNHQVLIADGTKTKSVPLQINGRIVAIIAVAPDIPTDTVFLVTINDEDGQQIYQKNDFGDNNVITRVDLSSATELFPEGAVLVVSFATDLSGDTVEIDVKFEFVGEF